VRMPGMYDFPENGCGWKEAVCPGRTFHFANAAWTLGSADDEVPRGRVRLSLFHGLICQTGCWPSVNSGRRLPTLLVIWVTSSLPAQ